MSDQRRGGEKSKRPIYKLIVIGLGILACVAISVLLQPSLNLPTSTTPTATLPSIIIQPTGDAVPTGIILPSATATVTAVATRTTLPSATVTGTGTPTLAAQLPVFTIEDTCESLFQGEDFSNIDYGLARTTVHGYSTFDLGDSTIYLIVEDKYGQLWVSDRTQIIIGGWSAYAYVREGEPSTIFAVAGDAGFMEGQIHNSILDPAVFGYISSEYVTNSISCNVPSSTDPLTREPNSTEIPEGTKASTENPVGEVLVIYPERLSPSSTDLVTLSIYLPIPVELMQLIDADVEPIDVSIVELSLDAGPGITVGRNKSYQGTILISQYMWARFESINISALSRQTEDQMISLDGSGTRTTWMWDILAPETLGRQNFSIRVGKVGDDDPVWRGDFELEIVQLTPVPTNTSLPTDTPTHTPSPTKTYTSAPSFTPAPTFTSTPWYEPGVNKVEDNCVVIIIFLIGLGILAAYFRRITSWGRKLLRRSQLLSPGHKSKDEIEKVPTETASPGPSPLGGRKAADSKPGSARIFISYRRSDSADVAGRIYDRLIERFGREPIFKDVDSIPLGLDFKEYLDRKVGECNILLAIIGDHWLEASDSTGKRRLEDPNDFVRIEIESALARDIPVIPLLVRDAKMPAEGQLPPNLKKLVYRNGTPIRSDPDFHRDMDRLISALEKYVQ